METKVSRKRDLRKLWEKINNGESKPPKNEKVWFGNPLIAFLFAKYHKRAPYSSELETLFYGNVKAIYCYMNWVIYDLGLDRPEHLHNYMIAKSLESDLGSDKEWVDLYFQKVVNAR